MKNYLVFYWPTTVRMGGFDDFETDFHTLDQAKNWVEKFYDKDDLNNCNHLLHHHVVDLRNAEIHYFDSKTLTWSYERIRSVI
jgi:hypothetical protein